MLELFIFLGIIYFIYQTLPLWKGLVSLAQRVNIQVQDADTDEPSK